MGADSAIEWCDHTFNAWTGCQPASPGCRGCYAAAWAKRAGRDFAERRRTSEANWRWPLRWERDHAAFFALHGRRQMVFCNSLADVFDNQVPPEWRADLFRLIESTPHLDWLLLTKRVGNAAEMMFEARGGHLPLLPNVWLGATVVDQAEADRDIPKLLATPARIRFLSIEPMLGPIEFSNVGRRSDAVSQLGKSALSGIDWVICGGESGPGARPMHPDWARSLRDQCAAAGVPFLFKQWGEWAGDPGSPNAHVKPKVWNVKFWPGETVQWRTGKKAAGRLLDGRTHDDFPAT